MTEIWKPVLRREGEYEVSNLGRVRSLDRCIECVNGSRRKVKGKLLKPSLATGDFYYRVSQGRNEAIRLHVLVAEAFLGPRPSGLEVRHKNGDRHDSRASNLSYGTHLENMRDAVRHGTSYCVQPEVRWGKHGEGFLPKRKS